MQAVILAAGKGSRLHPVTLARSKAMLPILGKPLVERVMDSLAQFGLQDFVLVVNPNDPDILDHFQNHSAYKDHLRLAYQSERKGMADALRQAAPLIEGDFVLSACDNLVPPAHISELLQTWNSHPSPNAVLSLMPMPVEKLRSSGVVALQGDWIIRIVEKPAPEERPSDIASLPLYILPQLILDYLPDIRLSPRGEYELQDALQWIIERHGGVRGVITPQRQTVTTLNDLLALNLHYLAESPDLLEVNSQVGAGANLQPPVFIAHQVTTGAGCTIGPNVIIEPGCVIGAGSHIHNSLLLHGAMVPERAMVAQQVCW
jgi:NDP-sugar pyrophosphorylase family protein